MAPSVGEEALIKVETAATPLHTEVLGRLRDYIADGNLADGARVPERQLCEMFGISRTPLREAVKVLVAEIEAAHHEMYGFYIRQDMAGYFGCNQHIHQLILAAAHNENLSAAYAMLADRLRRVRFSANLARKRARWGEAMREHESMLDALRRRDGTELGEILFQHLRNKRDAAIDYLQETGSILRQD